MELKIQVPEGMRIDVESSTFECIKFKPIEEDKCYKDVAVKLFLNKETYYNNTYGDISSFTPSNNELSTEPNNCTSEQQVKKLLAINKLMNIAKYLNGRDWKPDFEQNTPKYYIEVDQHLKLIRIDYTCKEVYSVVYFKNSDLAEQAIKILGEETIRLAMNTDW